MDFTLDQATKWLELFGDEIEQNKAYLSDLDTPIGDADHGFNMARGMEAVKTSLAQKAPADLAGLFKQTAMALITKVGGASGPLYGTAFLEMSKQAAQTSELNSLLAAALAGIKKRGGAAAGDKTMVDVWEAVLPELAQGTLTDAKIDEAVEATKPLIAKKGRASYLGERSKGHIDPGAMSSGYLFKALLKAVA